MLKIALIFLILILTGASYAQSKCFENGGLKDKHTFLFEADGGDVVGSYYIERGYDVEQTETYDFSGARTGNKLTVKFANYAKLPNHPFEVKGAILTLVKNADTEVLKVKFYGKGKSTVDAMNLEACEASFGTLSQSAKRISFIKNSDSASFVASFNSQKERRAFWLTARKNQTISVSAPGCGISFYYPDQTEYQKGKAIDVFGLEKILQAGDYLFVISPAGELNKCSTTFKITN